MADWSVIKTREDFLKSNIRAVPSRLKAKRTNKAGARDDFVISGAELSRRVNTPESMTSQVVLGQYLCLGKGKLDKNGKSHLIGELPRLVALARDAEDTGKAKGSIYSNFSLLAEEEVKELGKSMEKFLRP